MQKLFSKAYTVLVQRLAPFLKLKPINIYGMTASDGTKNQKLCAVKKTHLLNFLLILV